MLIAHRGTSSVEEDVLILNECNGDISTVNIKRRRNRHQHPKTETPLPGEARSHDGLN
jgi:hypothetical protein